MARMAPANSRCWLNISRAARSPAVAAASPSGPAGLPYICRAQRGRVANARALTGGMPSFSTRLPSGTGGSKITCSACFASSHAYNRGLISS